MRKTSYRLGRGVLVALCIAGLLAAVGLLENDAVPAWAVGVTLAGALLFAYAAWLVEITHGAAPHGGQSFTVPGGRIGYTRVKGSMHLHDVWAQPTGAGVIWLGTLSPNDWRRLALADSPRRLMALTSLLGHASTTAGVR